MNTLNEHSVRAPDISEENQSGNDMEQKWLSKQQSCSHNIGINECTDVKVDEMSAHKVNMLTVQAVSAIDSNGQDASKAITRSKSPNSLESALHVRHGAAHAKTTSETVLNTQPVLQIPSMIVFGQTNKTKHLTKSFYISDCSDDEFHRCSADDQRAKELTEKNIGTVFVEPGIVDGRNKSVSDYDYNSTYYSSVYSRNDSQAHREVHTTPMPQSSEATAIQHAQIATSIMQEDRQTKCTRTIPQNSQAQAEVRLSSSQKSADPVRPVYEGLYLSQSEDGKTNAEVVLDAGSVQSGVTSLVMEDVTDDLEPVYVTDFDNKIHRLEWEECSNWQHLLKYLTTHVSAKWLSLITIGFFSMWDLSNNTIIHPRAWELKVLPGHRAAMKRWVGADWALPRRSPRFLSAEAGSTRWVSHDHYGSIVFFDCFGRFHLLNVSTWQSWKTLTKYIRQICSPVSEYYVGDRPATWQGAGHLDSEQYDLFVLELGYCVPEQHWKRVKPNMHVFMLIWPRCDRSLGVLYQKNKHTLDEGLIDPNGLVCIKSARPEEGPESPRRPYSPRHNDQSRYNAQIVPSLGDAASRSSSSDQITIGSASIDYRPGKLPKTGYRPPKGAPASGRKASDEGWTKEQRARLSGDWELGTY